MIGQSEAFRSIERLISRIASFDASVLIEGETGTGKELAARAVHYASPRRDYPFVPVNCGALPDSLIENELFGHRRGAFTDANNDQAGLIALARSGTLFLDEIDMLSARGQVILLRFLQDRNFRPLGGREEERADVRVIAASNRNLDRQVVLGQFRQDLHYRLRLLEVKIPPLRDRRDDIGLLVSHFVDVASARFGKPAKPMDPNTIAWFERYEWPGNVRELEHLVYREFLLAQGSMISIPEPASMQRVDNSTESRLHYMAAKRRAIDDFEGRFLSGLIARTGGNISAAARLSGTDRRHLGRLLRKHQIIKSHN